MLSENVEALASARGLFGEARNQVKRCKDSKFQRVRSGHAEAAQAIASQINDLESEPEISEARLIEASHSV